MKLPSFFFPLPDYYLMSESMQLSCGCMGYGRWRYLSYIRWVCDCTYLCKISCS